MTYSLTEINGMSQAEFTEVCGAVFEDTPAIASASWSYRPFTTIDDLHRKMVEVVEAFSRVEQLKLIWAHPDLGSKAKMAEASVQEQESAGLNHLNPVEFVYLQTLNQTYKNKFGFPFIIAVKNLTKASIFQAFEQRLNNSTETELQQAIAEINQIARLRLTDLIASD